MTNQLKEIAGLFFKLGLIAFGGPAAHIAMMEDEVVSKRKWMSREQFLDLVGATNLIPGPNSTEMAIHCGYQRAGWPGLITAGVCFIFPAVTLTGLLAWFYTRYGSLPRIEPFFYGIRPAVIAIIIGAVLKLGKKALKGRELGIIGLCVMGAVFSGLSEILSILGGGLLGMYWLSLKNRGGLNKNHIFLIPIQKLSLAGLMVSTSVIPFSTAKLFFSFLKIGSILFGSGYVLIAYLEGEFIHRLGWLSQSQLLDAVAMGQFTPGPVLSTATFIGFLLAGVKGAVLATVGIFLPSFLFVLILNPIIPKLRQSKLASHFLDSVNISAVGIMVAVVAKLGLESIADWKTTLIAAASVFTVWRFTKLNPVWIVLGGSSLGYLLFII